MKAINSSLSEQIEKLNKNLARKSNIEEKSVVTSEEDKKDEISSVLSIKKELETNEDFNFASKPVNFVDISQIPKVKRLQGNK